MDLNRLKVLRKYIDYMYETVGELYQLNIDVDEMIREDIDRFILTKSAYQLSKLLYGLHKLSSLVDQLMDLVNEFQKYIVMRKTYTYEEDNVIRGSVIWSRALVNITMFKPILQTIVIRTIDTPENTMLKLMLLHVKVLLLLLYRKICQDIKDIESKLAKELGGKVDVLGLIKADPEYIRRRFVEKHIQYIDRALRTSMLLHVRTSMRALEFADFDKMHSLELETISTKIEKELERLYRIVQSDSMKKWKPSWVFKAMTLYNNIKNSLHDLSNGVESAIKHLNKLGSEEIVRELKEYIRYMAWKLYELYILYLILLALRRTVEGLNISFDDRKVLVEYDDKRKLLTIYWGKPLQKSILSEVRTVDGKSLDSDLIYKLRGRPDLSIEMQGKVSIVLEAKFTRRIGYLTQARFKVMAYMYEYGADIGILAYPGVPRSPMSLDEEEQESFSIFKEAEEKNGLVIYLTNKSELHILPIKPLNTHYNANIDKLQRVVERFLITSIV